MNNPLNIDQELFFDEYGVWVGGKDTPLHWYHYTHTTTTRQYTKNNRPKGDMFEYWHLLKSHVTHCGAHIKDSRAVYRVYHERIPANINMCFKCRTLWRAWMEERGELYKFNDARRAKRKAYKLKLKANREAVPPEVAWYDV